MLEFEEFVTLASRFMVEEDAEAMQQELKEAFRLYDKEGGLLIIQINFTYFFTLNFHKASNSKREGIVCSLFVFFILFV